MKKSVLWATFLIILGLIFVLPFSQILAETPKVAAKEGEKSKVTVSIKITKQSLDDMRSDEVPDDVLKKLESIKNQEIPEGKFVDTLNKTLGEKQAGKFKSIILEDAERVYPWDKGPDKIDVSKYPAEQQANYKLFVQKCSKCHVLARGINSPLATPKEWKDYVDKMKKKKRSGLDAKSTETVLSFLNYDSSIRKKEILKTRLQEETAKSAKEAKK